MSRSAKWRVLRLLSIRGCSWTMQECKHYSGGNILSDGGFHKTRRGVQIISVGTRRVNLLTLSSVLQSTCILNLHFSILNGVCCIIIVFWYSRGQYPWLEALSRVTQVSWQRDSVTAWPGGASAGHSSPSMSRLPHIYRVISSVSWLYTNLVITGRTLCLPVANLTRVRVIINKRRAIRH